MRGGSAKRETPVQGRSVMTPDSSMIQPIQGAFTRLAEYIVHSGQAGVTVLVAVMTVVVFSVWLALRPQS